MKTLFSAESVYRVNAFYPLLHDDAEMQAVIAAAPGQIGRALRPFCHLLGLEVPEALRLPKRVRVRVAYPTPLPTGSSPVAEPHSPSRGEGEEDTPTPTHRVKPGGDASLPRLAGEGEEKRRPRRRTEREMAAAWLAWSERTGKPIDIRKVSSKVWGYIVHWPRDENCPPPEIGYGGRRWRPPKDYKPPERD